MPKGYRKNRIELVLEANILCDYGCGQQAHFRFANGKVCCSEATQSCLGRKEELSEAQKENYRRNPDRAKEHSEKLKGRSSWNAGLTKHDNLSVAAQAEKVKGLPIWNKGLTKETDSRVAGYGKKISKQRIEVGCNTCGKKLNKLPRHVSKTNFCNGECKAKWQSENMMNERNPVWVPRIMVKCDWCNKPLERLPKRANETNFCNRDCQNSYHSDRMLGDKNPAYEHGNALEPYGVEFNDKLKDRIRRRDCFTCQFCERTEFENLRKYRRKLNVHHIDYDKKNNGERNLISLCQACHSPTHSDREFWQAHYEARIKELYSTYEKGSNQ